MYCLWLRKTQYLCGGVLDYYNATPTKKGREGKSLPFLFLCRFSLFGQKFRREKEKIQKFDAFGYFCRQHRENDAANRAKQHMQPPLRHANTL